MWVEIRRVYKHVVLRRAGKAPAENIDGLHSSSIQSFLSGMGAHGNSETSTAGPSNGSNATQCIPQIVEDDDTSNSRTALECLRILLGPVILKQKERAHRQERDAAAGVKRKPPPLSIPLHGLRVEIVLAWIVSVHLPRLEAVA